ncbi:MAG: hypothetical protein IID09_00355, partial [Candidatus Hydrogenedentes bacterium]|nr:hypothetical protein [Candidatus Hydrogenedentota bacterium]
MTLVADDAIDKRAPHMARGTNGAVLARRVVTHGSGGDTKERDAVRQFDRIVHRRRLSADLSQTNRRSAEHAGCISQAHRQVQPTSADAMDDVYGGFLVERSTACAGDGHQGGGCGSRLGTGARQTIKTRRQYDRKPLGRSINHAIAEEFHQR